MLLYKNHRFHCEGVSFVIPDGFYLDTSYEDIHQDTLNLWSKDRNLYICISIQRETKDPYEELALILRELEDIEITLSPEPVTIGGLTGYAAAYTSMPKHYWEAHLEIDSSNDGQTELLILLRSQNQVIDDGCLNRLLPLVDIRSNHLKP